MRLPRGTETVLGVSELEEVEGNRLRVGAPLIGGGLVLGLVTLVVLLYVPGFPAVVETINGNSRLALLVLAPALLFVFLGAVQVVLYVEELDNWLLRGVAAVGCLVGAGLYGLTFPMTTPLFAAGVGPTPHTLLTVTRWSPVVILLLAGGFLLRVTLVLTPE